MTDWVRGEKRLVNRSRTTWPSVMPVYGMAAKMMTASRSSVASNVPWIGRLANFLSSASSTVTTATASRSQPPASPSQRVQRRAACSRPTTSALTGATAPDGGRGAAAASLGFAVPDRQRSRLLEQRLARQLLGLEVGGPLLVENPHRLAPTLALVARERVDLALVVHHRLAADDLGLIPGRADLAPVAARRRGGLGEHLLHVRGQRVEPGLVHEHR